MVKFQQYAGLGAACVACGTFLAYAALVILFRPVANGGFDRVLWITVSIAMLIPVAVLAGAHLAFAKQLTGGPRGMPR